MAVFERLRESMAVPAIRSRELFRKQPATCTAAVILIGLSIPIGISFRLSFQALQAYAQKYALAEAELAALRLDRSIAQHRTDWNGERPLDDRSQVCSPYQTPPQDRFPSDESIQLEALALSPQPDTAQTVSLTPLAIALFPLLHASLRSLDMSAVKVVRWSHVQPVSAPVEVSHPDVSECQWLEPLSTESLAPTLPTFTGELRSYWFLLDEYGHPLFTPERISADHLDGWSAPNALQWQELAQVMNSSHQGIFAMMVGEHDMYVAHSRLEETNWLLGLAIPHQDFERNISYLNTLFWLVGLGGVTAATSVGLSFANHRSAERARGDLRNLELRAERERLNSQASQLQQQEQLQVQREETVKTISNSMTGPLTNLKQAITLLSDYGATLHPTQLKGYTEVMEQAIGRLAHTFDRIVSLRNLDSNSLAPRLAPVNLSQLCADLVSRCRGGKHNRIELSFRGTCGTVYLDSYLVQVALEPILRNAVKYCGNHPELPPIQFTIDCRSSERVEFTVIDKGLGIPEQDLKQVVQPFVRGQNVHHIPGTGLGLAIAEQAIEAMDGELQIVSRPGAGTTVTVIVPTEQQPQVNRGLPIED